MTTLKVNEWSALLHGEKETYETKSLIIATGAMQNICIESEKRLLGKGVSACYLWWFLLKDQDVAVVVVVIRHLKKHFI